MTDKRLERLRHAARFSFRPKYSLFSVSSKGEYSLIGQYEKPEETLAAFDKHAWSYTGMEVRVDGVRCALHEEES